MDTSKAYSKEGIGFVVGLDWYSEFATSNTIFSMGIWLAPFRTIVFTTLLNRRHRCISMVHLGKDVMVREIFCKVNVVRNGIAAIELNQVYHEIGSVEWYMLRMRRENQSMLPPSKNAYHSE